MCMGFLFSCLLFIFFVYLANSPLFLFLLMAILVFFFHPLFRFLRLGSENEGFGIGLRAGGLK
jgi:predicted PurR-regulated permease PerM